MEKRFYFLLGDLVSNMLCGATAAVICTWLLSGLPMIIGMLLGMVLGMLVSMVLLFSFLMRMFGAMEVMVQCMTTAMLAGMFGPMFISSGGAWVSEAVWLGLETGLAVFVVTWILNSALSGPQTVKER